MMLSAAGQTQRPKRRSIRVLALDGFSSVVEYTTFSAACQIAGEVLDEGGWSANLVG